MFEVGKKYSNPQVGAVQCKCVHIHNENGINFGWLLNFAGTPFTGTWSPDWKECREPVKVSGWVNVYEDSQGMGLWKTRKEAVGYKSSNRLYLCTIYVSGEEGKEPCSNE